MGHEIERVHVLLWEKEDEVFNTDLRASWASRKTLCTTHSQELSFVFYLGNPDRLKEKD